MRSVCIRSREKKIFKIYTGKPKDKPNPLAVANTTWSLIRITDVISPREEQWCQGLGSHDPMGSQRAKQNPRTVTSYKQETEMISPRENTSRTE